MFFPFSLRYFCFEDSIQFHSWSTYPNNAWWNDIDTTTLARTSTTNLQVPNIVIPESSTTGEGKRTTTTKEQREAYERGEGGVDPKTTARDTLLVTTIATTRKAFGKDGREKNYEPAKRTFLERTPTKKREKKDNNDNDNNQTASCLASIPSLPPQSRGLLCVSTHWHRRRGATFVAMWWYVRRRGHHHRIRVLHCGHHCKHLITIVLIKRHHTLRALMVVWVGMRRDRRWGHRWSGPCSVGRRRVRAWRWWLHVCLR